MTVFAVLRPWIVLNTFLPSKLTRQHKAVPPCQMQTPPNAWNHFQPSKRIHVHTRHLIAIKLKLKLMTRSQCSPIHTSRLPAVSSPSCPSLPQALPSFLECFSIFLMMLMVNYTFCRNLGMTLRNLFLSLIAPISVLHLKPLAPYHSKIHL